MEYDLPAESAFWRSGRYLRLLIENAEDYAIFSLGLDGRITSWNAGARRLLGWEADEVLGESSAILFTEEDRAAGIPERERAVAVNEGRAEDTRWHVCKKGERFWANGVMIAVEDEAGEIVGFAKILRDLTDQKRYEEALETANEQLEQSNRNLEAFASHVAHEMRSPLTGFRIHLNLLFRKYDDVLDEETLALAREAREALDDLDRFVTDLLAYARMGGPAELNRELVDSGEVLKETLNVLKPEIERRGAQITHGDLPQVYANATQLRHLFRNLISNAIRYNDADVPRVEVDVEQNEETWLFRVRDNGIGIPEDAQDRIFTPFGLAAQFERSGVGVGLSLCRRIVEQHGGRIWVESEPGAGSTFLFSLPKRREAAAEDEPTWT